MKFCLFSDFHYKKRMYASTIPMMGEIVDKAAKNGVDFILHCGDLCNDYSGSKELFDCLLKNRWDIPVYGVYGNHELESENNSMRVVTYKLTNRITDVIWGTDSKNIENGCVSYFYFDFDVFRIICLDTSYSFNVAEKIWEHNKTASWCAPRENIKTYSLGERQSKWLQTVLDDAVNSNRHCILVSHAPFLKEWRKDARMNKEEDIEEMLEYANERKKKTVIACFSGHWHTDRSTVKKDILFFDTNSAVNGFWEEGHTESHYNKNHTYIFRNYDSEGNSVGEDVKAYLDDTYMGKETWYFERPLSTVVEVSDDCTVTVKGMCSKWAYDVFPPTDDPAVIAKISSLVFRP